MTSESDDVALGISGSRMGRLYTHLVNIPDEFVGWIPSAYAAGRRLLRSWEADLIFASGPPFTTLILGNLLARRHQTPLVAEFRDRWWDDPYYPPPRWRQKLGERLERWAVRDAAGLITVSAPWAETYRRRYERPTIVVYNGYDPQDYITEPSPRTSDADGLTITYTGVIYPGRRDPSPLFEALRLLERDDGAYRVEFYGTDPHLVFPLAEKFGVQRLISVHPRIPRDESLAIQQRSDILLLMQWNNPKEQGNVPGKLFDYLAARRPILGLGLETGVPATIIRERSAGFFCNDAVAIANQLKAWRALKQAEGAIAPLPDSVFAGYSRDDQNGELEDFLIKLVNKDAESNA